MTSEGEEAESKKEDESGITTIELQRQLADVNNRLQLAESERNQYASKCHELQKQIDSSEDIREDPSKKCNEQKNLNSPNPSHGKITSPSGSREGSFEGKSQINKSIILFFFL